MKPACRPWSVLALLLCVGALGPTAMASAAPEPLRAQFALPPDRIDYAEAKLAIDRLIDPETDAVAVRRELDAWTKATDANMPAGADERGRLEALLKTLYEPGPWNEGRPFSYDLSDPMGRKPANKLLATYLATRKGNCVSMPILLVILAQRLDLTLTLATAPAHVLAKFADDRMQTWVNVEATGGGFKYDSSYERDLDISSVALDNGIYLRPLRPRESVGVMASTLMEHYAREKDADALLAVAELALEANPKDTVAMIWKANAHYLQLQQRYVQRYPRVSDIPTAEHTDYLRLSQENLAWFAKAEQLGWAPRTPEQEAKYLATIQREKAQRGM